MRGWNVGLFRFRLPGEGARCAPPSALRPLLAFASLALTVYLLWYAFHGTAAPHFQVSVMLSIVLPFTFLTTTLSKAHKQIKPLDVILAVLGFAVGLFYVLNDDVYTNWVEGISTVDLPDKIAAIFLIALAIEACRRSVGWGLTAVILVLVAYVVFGPYAPGGLRHGPVDMDYFINMQTMTTNGVFGDATQIVASYAFMFLLFGTFYHKSGGGRLFFDVAAALTRNSIGGPSKACVVSSGLYGSISGSPVADVATTGPITIRIMKDAGISSVRAGGVEAAASSGGAILPPIMGSVVFIMADFTGLGYTNIAKSAIISGVLFYVGVIAMVHFEALRHGEGRIPLDMVVGMRKALARGWMHIIPIFVLVYLILKDYSLPLVASAAIFTTIVLSWFTRNHRIGPRAFLEACYETVYGMAPLAMAVIGAGIIIGCIELSGLSGKFSLLLSILGGGYLLPTLFFGMVVLILLGMGMPTPAVYLMGAALLAPHFVRHFDLPVLGTHMWLVYIASMSAITPPVAVACFAAGAIAKADPMQVAFYACRLAAVGFVLPYFFLFNPAVLLQGDWLQIVLSTCLALVVVLSLAVVFSGWVGGRQVAWWLRVLFGLLTVSVIYPYLPAQAFAALLAIAIYAALIFRVRGRTPSVHAVSTQATGGVSERLP